MALARKLRLIGLLTRFHRVRRGQPDVPGQPTNYGGKTAIWVGKPTLKPRQISASFFSIYTIGQWHTIGSWATYGDTGSAQLYGLCFEATQS